MTNIKRRHFLQLAGSTMAALGLDQANFLRQGDQYGRVLAQPTGRKVALLVGVNQYPGQISDLRGCVNDVEMQKQLLMHRYGFKASDIHLLTDQTAQPPTRNNILDAFEEYLINGVRPGDVAVFHYSGHGSRVIDEMPLSNATLDSEGNGLNGTLLPYDARSNAGARVNDIMGKTLFLLSKAVKTDHFTMVLDSCHSGGGTRGNVLVRNVEPRPGESEALPSEMELAFQEKWRRKLNLSKAEFQRGREAGIARGMALGSAQASQYATDAVFEDFYAGAFSYLLTQYLWQLPSSELIERSFNQLALITRDVAGASGIVQDPIYEVQDESYRSKPIYFTQSIPVSAEGVLQEVEGNQVKYWMGGISSRSLESYGNASVFNLVDQQGNKVGEVEQTGRQGLLGEGVIRPGQGKLRAGLLMQEQVRGIPSDLSLKVGLDASLGQLIPQLKTELQSLKRITPVVVDPKNPSESVDYLLGRLTTLASEEGKKRNIKIQAPEASVGILSSSLVPVPDSFGLSRDESAEAVASRLGSRLKMLLAGKILTSVVNSESSDLNVDVNIQSVKGGGLIAAQRSRSDRAEAFLPKKALTGINNQVKAGDEIEVVVTNKESRNLYIGVLVISNTGELAVLHPLNFEDPDAASLVGAKRSIAVPEKTGNPDEDFRFEVQGPAGFFELMVLASTEPLREALKALKVVALNRGMSRGNPLDFFEGSSRGPGESDDAPVEIMQALLGDVSCTRAGIGVTRGTQRVATSGLAGFSSMIEVID